MELTLLRGLGLAGAAIFLCLAVLRLRQRQASPLIPGALAFTGAALALVVLMPSAVGALARALSLEGFEGNRLLVLLMLAVVVLWSAVMGLMSREQRLKDDLDRLIRHTALRDVTPGVEAAEPEAVACVIPALNEARNIGAVLARMPLRIDGHPVHTIVVDDGSSDDTTAVARQHGAFVARNPFRRGGGAALRAGFDVARAMSAQAIVTLDADGQNDPREIGGVVRPILDGEADIVIGSRMLGRHENPSRLRHTGVLVFSAIFKALMGVRVTDISSGFRALRSDALADLTLRQDQYHTSEFLVSAAKNGLRIAEAPITFKKRLSGQSKKGPELLYGARFARVLFQSWLRAR